jgi:hypothetical protein
MEGNLFMFMLIFSFIIVYGRESVQVFFVYFFIYLFVYPKTNKNAKIQCISTLNLILGKTRMISYKNVN